MKKSTYYHLQSAYSLEKISPGCTRGAPKLAQDPVQVVGAGGLSAAAPRTPTSSAAHHEHHAGAGWRHGPATLLREFVPRQDKLKVYMQS